MIIEIIIFVLIGILLGIFTGLIPGIHTNLLAAIVVSISASILIELDKTLLITLITSLATSHTFISFIPSIFLGCPDTDTELSVLPGHEMLKKGEGYNAIILTSYGSIAAILILILISIPSYFFLEKIYGFLQNFMAYILMIVSLTLIIIQKNKLKSLLAFFLAGTLGLITLGVGFDNPINPFLAGLDINEPILPLLTGLFGASMLIISIKTKVKIPKQKIENPKIDKNILKPLAGAFVASPISSLLPGLGSGQAAIIGNLISKTDRNGFLVLLGATNTLVMSFSFISLYIVSRTRTGAAVAINQIIGNFPLQTMITIFLVVTLTGMISFLMVFPLAKTFSRKISEINYTKVSLGILAFLSAIVLTISGFLGLIVLIVSTLTGIYCINLGVRRTNMMGCLLIPTIIFYLTI